MITIFNLGSNSEFIDRLTVFGCITVDWTSCNASAVIIWMWRPSCNLQTMIYTNKSNGKMQACEEWTIEKIKVERWREEQRNLNETKMKIMMMMDERMNDGNEWKNELWRWMKEWMMADCRWMKDWMMAMNERMNDGDEWKIEWWRWMKKWMMANCRWMKEWMMAMNNRMNDGDEWKNEWWR